MQGTDIPSVLLRNLLRRERCFYLPPFLARFSFLGYKGASVWSQSTLDTRISVWAGGRIQISTALSCHFLRVKVLAVFRLLFKSLRTLRSCKLQRLMRKCVHVIQYILILESVKGGMVLRMSVGIWPLALVLPHIQCVTLNTVTCQIRGKFLQLQNEVVGPRALTCCVSRNWSPPGRPWILLNLNSNLGFGVPSARVCYLEGPPFFLAAALSPNPKQQISFFFFFPTHFQ